MAGAVPGKTCHGTSFGWTRNEARPWIDPIIHYDGAREGERERARDWISRNSGSAWAEGRDGRPGCGGAGGDGGRVFSIRVGSIALHPIDRLSTDDAEAAKGEIQTRPLVFVPFTRNRHQLGWKRFLE